MTTLAAHPHSHRRALSDIGVGQPSRSRSRDPSPSPYRTSFEHQPHYTPPSPYHSSHSSRDQSPYKTRETSPYSVRVPAPAPPHRSHSREPVHHHVRTTSFPAAAPPFPRPSVLVPSPAPTVRTLAPAHEYDFGYDSDFLTAPPAPQPHSHSHSRSRSHSHSHPNGLPGSLPKMHHASAPVVPTYAPTTYVVNVPAPAPAPRSRSPRGRRSRDSPPSSSKTHHLPAQRSSSRIPAALPPPKIHVIDFAAHQAQSKRPYQEDGYVIGPPARYTSRASDTTAPVTAFFGVYDGHGGAFSSTHAAKALHSHLIRSRAYGIGGRSGYEAALREAFAKEDAKLRAHQRAQHCGSTAVVALVDADAGQLYVANAGDSRAVLGAREGSHMKAIRISEDHNPTNPAERARIEAAGGFITADGRVGTLAVSRGLGDHAYKLTPGAPPAQGASPAFYAALRPGMQPIADLVSGSPHIASVALSNTNTPFLVLGSDGLFNALTDQTIVDTMAKLHAQKWTAKAMAQHLVDTAVGKSNRGRGDGDNVTAVVVVFA